MDHMRISGTEPSSVILNPNFFFAKSPVGPKGGGVGLDQNCTCTTTTPWGKQNVTTNRSLQYLVTEEIEEQDIV